MKIISHLKSAGLGCFPCRQDKTPKVKNWKEDAFLPENQLPPSNIWGLVIPPRILIIDLDLYKINKKEGRKITREDANQALGCTLPWNQSLIQKTQSGGEHHAFLVDHDDIAQNSSKLLEGLDTRVAGKGYICFGNKYTEVGLGIGGLVKPDSFPRLPDAAYEVLRRSPQKHSPPLPPTMKADVDIVKIKEALASIDPDCTRDQWRNVGFALKDGFGDDPKGFEFWNQWSKGDFSGNGTPQTYIEEDLIKQWESFKKDVPGRIRIKSLFYYADMYNHNQMSIDEISKLVGLNKHVGSSPHLPTIIHVNNIPPWVIADHPIVIDDNPRIKDKRPRFVDEQCIEGILKGEYGFRFKSFNGTPRWWSGREWEYIGKTDLINFITNSLPTRYRDMGRINKICEFFLHRISNTGILKPSKKIFFRDGVLDLYSGEFEQHKKENYNIGTLSVNYKDEGKTVEWIKFLHSILEKDDIKRLQDIILWFLIHHNFGIEKYVAFTGASRAGKGVILRVIKNILGIGFYGSFNFSALGTPQGHAALWKHQVVIDMEAKPPRREEKISTLETIQKVTSNETISSRVLFENEYKEGVVNCKIGIACNNLPIFSDDSGAAASRIEILKFTKSFLGKEDKHLFGRLSKELPGITQWALGARERMIVNNWIFTKTKSSIEEMIGLEKLTKILNPFKEDYLIIDPESRVSSKALYSCYKLYCENNKMSIWSETMFIKRLKDTLSDEKLEWCRYRENGVQISGVIGMKIIDSVLIPGISPSSAPLPPTSMS